MDISPRPWKRYLRNALFALLGVVLVGGSYALFLKLGQTRAELAERDAEAERYQVQLDQVRAELIDAADENEYLHEELEEERERNDDFERQIRKLTGTVGELDKLSKLDVELLQKYSKVYFLNEHYAPPRIKEIDKDFRFRKNEPEYIHAQVEPFLERLLEDAKEDGIDLLVLSGYRSFDEQRSLKGAYTVQYGSGANTFSADQGYSEHQLGTTVDFTTASLNGALTGFEHTEAYAWLQKRAYRHGFILSYPANNQYYVFEPWHWRFVGEELADDLHDDKENFYDMDQREIEKYLISIFD